MAFLFSAVLFQPLPAAENPADSSSISPAPQELPPGFMDSTLADSIPGVRLHKSPGGAILRAMALPGWGQFYTGHPVRGSLAAVLETVYFSAMTVKFRDRNRLIRTLHARERAPGQDWPVDDPERVALNEQIKNVNRKAGDYLAYGVTTLVLSMVDSYVSAHLYHFGSNFYPATGRNAVSLRLEF